MAPKRVTKPATHCSPARYCNHKNTGSCLLASEIIPILRANGIVPSTTSSQVQLVSLLRITAARMNRSEQSLADSAGFRTAFRPVAPASWGDAKSSTWLSSDDIDDVMRQYEVACEDFKFIGVSPIDFADRPVTFGGKCVTPAMCDLDVPALVRLGKTTQLGVVLNMDKHDARGSHWVAVYIGLDSKAPNYGVFYYDSVANPPDKRVKVWMAGIASIMKRGGRQKSGPGSFLIGQNRIRRQFGQSECGIFSMMFLIHCMQKKLKFQSICKTLGNDDIMKALRAVLFRPV